MGKRCHKRALAKRGDRHLDMRDGLIVGAGANAAA
jgi:hypothetical protein